MQLGDYKLTTVLAGEFGLDGGAMFGVVPKPMWEKRLPPDDVNRVPMVMRLLVAEGHGRTILVDVGAGVGHSEKNRQIYALSDTPGLRALIADAGVDPDAITDIVLTHLHFDHGAGVAAPDGDGWTLLFPGARHHVQRSQYAHALDPNPRDRASYYRERIIIMEDEGVLELHDGEWTLCPGFDLPVFDGHTPGQQLPRISGPDDTLFYCGDLIPTQHHIPTPYIMAYDLEPVLAMREKLPVLERAATENWILFFEHDAHLEACRLDRDGKRFRPGASVVLG